MIDFVRPLHIELRYIYKTKIQGWFRDIITKKDHSILFNAIINGDAETFQVKFSDLLANSISYMDGAENFYHGFITGMLAGLRDYAVKSNRESGNGRYDIVLYRINGNNSIAVIFEFKIAKTFDQLPTACEKALKQIEEKNYAADWDKEGFKNIIKYGIGFYGKRCEIRKGT